MDASKLGHFLIDGVYVGTTRLNEMVGKADDVKFADKAGYWGLRLPTTSAHGLVLDVGGDSNVYTMVTDSDKGSLTDFGILKVGGELTVTGGVVSYKLPAATASVLGGMKFSVADYSGAETTGVGKILS